MLYFPLLKTQYTHAGGVVRFNTTNSGHNFHGHDFQSFNSRRPFSSSSAKKRKPALPQVRLVGNHEEKDHQKQGNAPRSPTGPVERLLLRKRHVNPKPLQESEQLHRQNQQQGRDHEEQLDPIKKGPEHALKIHVPCETYKCEQYEEEEAKVGRQSGL